jgi:hypothetical protein
MLNQSVISMYQPVIRREGQEGYFIRDFREKEKRKVDNDVAWYGMGRIRGVFGMQNASLN